MRRGFIFRLPEMPLLRPKPRLEGWLRIPKSTIDVSAIKARLTLVNPAYFKAQQYTGAELDREKAYIRVFREDAGALYVPRAYGIPLVTTGGYVDRSYFDHVEWPPDSITLGPNRWQPYDQKPAYEALVAKPESGKGRLLVLGCGKGKTVISLKAAMQRQVPVAVIVDTTELLNQWRERIVEFCGIAQGDIGQVGKGECRWEGYPITVMMTQTLMHPNRVWSSAFKRYFGLSIFDEVHVMGAPKFSRVVPLFYGERWGLTATPVREDGLDRIFRWHLAFQPCFSDVEQTLVPDVWLVPIERPSPDVYIFGPKSWKKRWWTERDIHSADQKTKFMFAKILGMRNPRPRVADILRTLVKQRRGSIPATISNISQDEVGNAQIVDVVHKLEKQGRTVLVLGSRTDQLIWLRNHYPGDCGLLYGKVPLANREEQLRNHPVVFAAQKMVKKGLDRPAFDTLVYLHLDPELCTEPNVQQGVGRIQRERKGKRAVRVFAFVHKSSTILNPTTRRFVQNLRKVLGMQVSIRTIQKKEVECCGRQGSTEDIEI